ncbi:MAG TPA: HAMP domain-containing sensor histidine kinase [Ktedonobacterales bacterium]|nr:HAMP domain-containing sensor histidine kinase [Ktedonobacterales bacterium]
MRQQQNDEQTHPPDFLRATEPPVPHPAQPRTHPPGLVYADLAALSHLLVTAEPAESALASAVEAAARLLPAARMLRLFLTTPTAPTAMTQLVTASRVRSGTPAQAVIEPAPAETLGYGERVDRQVLRDVQIARPAGAICLPLSDAGGMALGALVIELPPSGPRPDPALLAILADTLSALLRRHAAEGDHARLMQLLDALPALALPPESASEGAAELPIEERAAGLLRECAHVLEDLTGTGTTACVPLVRAPNGAWNALPGSTLPGDIGLTPEQAAVVLAEARGEPVVITPDDDDMLWSEFAPLRQRAGYPVSRIHLLPAATPDRAYALYALAEAPDALPAARWMPLARALLTALTAGLATIELRADVLAEAQARDAYISLAAHELRGPLTSIKGYAQLLARQARKNPLPESMMRSVEAVEQQSMRLSEMLGELLDASRIRRGSLLLTIAPVELVGLAERVVERRRAFFPLHDIQLDVPAEPVVAAADATRVEQVLRDLIDNAAHHSPSGDPITVSISQANGGTPLVSVRDNGIGIAAEDRDRLFEYLYRAPRSQQRNLSGLGLGLYVSAYLVEQMGGHLWLESSRTESPAGSDFRFTLPSA